MEKYQKPVWNKENNLQVSGCLFTSLPCSFFYFAGWEKNDCNNKAVPACIRFSSVPVCFELNTVLRSLLFCSFIASAQFKLFFPPSLLTFPLCITFNDFFKCLVSSRSHYHLSFVVSPFFKYMFRSLFLHSFGFHSSPY